MDSKLQAARMVNDAGDALIIADGRTDQILPRLLAGEELGTLFAPEAGQKRSSRGRWIGMFVLSEPLLSTMAQRGA